MNMVSASKFESRLRAALMAKEILLLQARGPIHLEIEQFAAFQIIGALQLATRHPQLDPTIRRTAESFGHNLQQAFMSATTPQLGLTLEQGWHTEYDVKREADDDDQQ